jgi:hypothetical protein
MNKKNFFFLFIFFISLGIISVLSRSVYSSQGGDWETPATKFPTSGNETQIFDEGRGPGETKKRVMPLIFDGVGQAINFGAGQSISSPNNNAQIMFAPAGIVITSLAGPVLFNTKGLVLKNNESIPSASVGAIALINNELKFNTDGTALGWKLSGAEGIWKNENYPGGFSFRYETNDVNSMNFTFYHARKLNCDISNSTRDCGDFVEEEQISGTGGYEEFSINGTKNYAVYDYTKAGAGGISFTSKNEKGFYSINYSVDEISNSNCLRSENSPCQEYDGALPLDCDIDPTKLDCPSFFPEVIYSSSPLYGRDKFVDSNGTKKWAIYEYKDVPISGSVTVGSDADVKKLTINGSLKTNGIFSFSPKTVIKSQRIKLDVDVGEIKTVTEKIRDPETGKTDFSFCGIGYSMFDKGYNGIVDEGGTGNACSVLYDGEKKSWMLSVSKYVFYTGVECGAICF